MVGATKNLRSLQAFRLGVMDYEEGLRLQNRLADARREDKIGDVLLLLQHPPVITLGKSGKVQNVLDPRSLQEKKIKVIFTDRGGDVTYHGPGQLVAYPILSLRRHGLSVPGYVWNLEETVIRLLARYGIPAGRIEKLRGVWVENEKIAALGVHLSNWVTKHGLALNVNTDLHPFNLINPCGTGRRVISMAKILGRELPMEEIEFLMLQTFQEVFGVRLDSEPLKNLEPYL
ncbi:MAG TPA: lipoyl(octanoyl) transferase LipB [Thermodesulfobacteriota bacterium]|nr:lipoyl(octanoyl) transferase LipB [Thermodesulfobacteriota bacterium]